jgi:hypothetical protein
VREAADQVVASIGIGIGIGIGIVVGYLHRWFMTKVGSSRISGRGSRQSAFANSSICLVGMDSDDTGARDRCRARLRRSRRAAATVAFLS